MVSNIRRFFFFGAVATLLVAGALLAPIGLSSKDAAAQSEVAPGDTVCTAPIKGQPRLADLIVAGQSPDGAGVYVKNIGCYATGIGFTVKVSLTDGSSVLTEYISVPQFIESDGVAFVPVAFDCDFNVARIEVDVFNNVFEVNEHNNVGDAYSTVC